jgi:hypothetical protein
MPALNHALEKLNVTFAPIDLPPVWVLAPICVNWIGVGDQEKGSWKAILVEDGNGLLELTSQSIVKCE